MKTLTTILAALALTLTAAAAAPLTDRDILGKWCSNVGTITNISPTSLTVTLKNGFTTTYAVRSFTFTDKTVKMYWVGNNNKNVYTEYGEFSGGRAMTLLNPRLAYRRCG